jgi:hypothetical protein
MSAEEVRTRVYLSFDQFVMNEMLMQHLTYLARISNIVLMPVFLKLGYHNVGLEINAGLLLH